VGELFNSLDCIDQSSNTEPYWSVAARRLVQLAADAWETAGRRPNSITANSPLVKFIARSLGAIGEHVSAEQVANALRRR
jgi:hypothetical protein